MVLAHYLPGRCDMACIVSLATADFPLHVLKDSSTMLIEVSDNFIHHASLSAVCCPSLA